MSLSPLLQQRDPYRVFLWLILAVVISMGLGFALVMATGGPNPGSGL